MGKYSDYQNTNKPISPQAPMYLTPEEKAAGIDAKLKVAARRYLCPKCSREFSLFQSRAVACKYCPKASDRCPNVRCPYCDSEFPISGFITPAGSRSDERIINDYTDDIFNRWADRYNHR